MQKVEHHENNEFDLKLKSIEETRDFLLSKTAYRPKVAIVCGTGLGGLADELRESQLFPYDQIPHFPTSTVPGHAGKLVFGKLSGKEVVCMQGRIHAYEGHSMWKVTFGIRVFAALGIEILIVTNASGGINRSLEVGDVLVLKDHINLAGMSGNNPLVGLNDERFGPRFQETTTCYDVALQKLAKKLASQTGSDYVKEGVYCYQSGPAFESPAEVRFLSLIGADAVGMSTVPEVLVARHCDLRVLGLSLVTNACVHDYDCDRRPNHLEVLETGARRSADLRGYLAKLVAEI